MALVEHSISLDLKNPLSVEPIQIFSSDVSAYSIVARITEDGKDKILPSGCTFSMKVEGVSDRLSGTQIGDSNRVRFDSLASIREGWSVCSVLIGVPGGNTTETLETQAFQILKKVNIPVQVDETPFITLSQEDLNNIVTVSTGLASANTVALTELSRANVDALSMITNTGDTALNTNKLAVMKVITAIQDDDDRSNGGSRVTSDGKLHITPKIADVQTNGTSKLSNGIVNIASTDIINTVAVKNDNQYEETIGSGSVNSATQTLNLSIDNGVEAIKYNGTPLAPTPATTTGHKNTVEIDALEAIRVKTGDETYVDLEGNALHTRVELAPGAGVAFETDTDDNSLTISFDPTSGDVLFPADQLSVPSNYSQGDVLVVHNGMMELKPLSEALGIQIGSDQVSITTNVSQTFDFADFPAQSTLDGTDLFPFLRGANGNKITWADMMTQFTQIHRSEYFTKTITAQDWGSSSTCAITITQQELQAKNLTAAKVIDQEGIYHSHAHVHPEPSSVYNYANFGVYCSNVTASNNDVVFTFVRNSTIQNTPSMDVTIEVRLG